MVGLEVLVGQCLNCLGDGLILAGDEDWVVDAETGPIARLVLCGDVAVSDVGYEIRVPVL